MPQTNAMSADYAASQVNKLLDAILDIQVQLNQLRLDFNSNTRPTAAGIASKPLPDAQVFVGSVV